MTVISPRGMMGLFGTVLLSLMLNAAAYAQEADAQKTYVAGKDYLVLEQPVHTRDPHKIEVVEVFWYGCPHCYHFDPLVNKWEQQQADDVDFWRSPAIWNGRMKVHAQMFYTAEALGIMKKMHHVMFTALVIERKPLAEEKQVEDLFAAHGVDREKFKQAYESFGVKSQVSQADARARSYHIAGTPEMIVDGKYRVTAGLAGGQAQMLKIVDFLVTKERAAKEGAAKTAVAK